MVKRLVYAAIGVLGLGSIGLGVASATAWRAADVLVADGTASSAVVVTDPGVLEMAGDPVTVRATVPDGGAVVLVVGREVDIAGWVGGDDHQRVTGLEGWHTLRLATPGATNEPTPTGATTPAPTPADTPPTSAAAGETAEGSASTRAPADPAGSDMWVAQAQGSGTATLTWAAREGRWSLLVVGTDASGAGAPPTLEFAWPRVVTTPWLVPGVLVGSLLVLVCLALFGRDWLRARRGPEQAQWTSVHTESLPLVGAASTAPTRRQLREAQARGSGGAVPTGSTQAVAEVRPSPKLDDAGPLAPAPAAEHAGRPGEHPGERRGEHPGGHAAQPGTDQPPAAPEAPAPGSRRARRAAEASDRPADPASALPIPARATDDAVRTAPPEARPTTDAGGPVGSHGGRPAWARHSVGEPSRSAPPRPPAPTPSPTAHPSWLPGTVDQGPAVSRPRRLAPAPAPVEDASHGEGGEVSRADAWRRAWGLPATDQDPASDDETRKAPRRGAGAGEQEDR